jgi:hypothetical protein
MTVCTSLESSHLIASLESIAIPERRALVMVIAQPLVATTPQELGLVLRELVRMTAQSETNLIPGRYNCSPLNLTCLTNSPGSIAILARLILVMERQDIILATALLLDRAMWDPIRRISPTSLTRGRISHALKYFPIKVHLANYSTELRVAAIVLLNV